MTRINSNLFKSHKSTALSVEHESKELQDFDAARWVTGARCPNSELFGRISTDLDKQDTAQTVIVQSTLAVTRVLESTKVAVDTWR